MAVVALLAKGDGESLLTQVVLRNSRRDGDEARLNTDRQFRVRAAQLGFRELESTPPNRRLFAARPRRGHPVFPTGSRTRTLRTELCGLAICDLRDLSALRNRVEGAWLFQSCGGRGRF